MDDSLERDQLNLWEKLNRLYGDDAGREAGPEEDTAAELAEAPPEPPMAEVEARHVVLPPEEGLGSLALEEIELAPGYRESIESGNEVNEVCADCRYGCEQPARGFVIDRCKLANASKPEKRGSTLNQVVASAGSMGIEKINETCRRCRRSCKQRTTKLNRMLCLGFVPIDDGRSEQD